jgi:hypothetical protein
LTWISRSALIVYRGAGKSLARPGRKQATFPAFYASLRFITTFTRVHHLSLPLPNQSIHLRITLLTGAACFFPGRAKDLSAPRVEAAPSVLQLKHYREHRKPFLPRCYPWHGRRHWDIMGDLGDIWWLCACAGFVKYPNSTNIQNYLSVRHSV